MGHFSRTLGMSLPIAALVLAAVTTPAWALQVAPMPVLGAGGIAGAAIIAAIIIAKLWRGR